LKCSTIILDWMACGYFLPLTFTHRCMVYIDSSLLNDMILQYVYQKPPSEEPSSEEKPNLEEDEKKKTEKEREADEVLMNAVIL